MPLILRQSTAKAVSFGPFLDKTDGVTLEVGLVSAIDHATTGILLSKNGGALTIRSQAVTASTYDAYGNYIVTLSATDTNTVGTLRAQFSEAATCLPVWQDFQVVEEAVFDAFYAASATGVPAAGALEATLTAMKGATYAEATDSLEALRDRGDAAWATATGFATPTNITAATGVALTSAYDFAKGTTAMTEAYAANGVAPTPVQAMFAIHQMLMQFGIATTNYTVKKLDNTTTAFVVTLDSATAPTAASRV